MSFRYLFLCCCLLSLGASQALSQEQLTAKLTFHFINNIDKQVSIEQMKNPGTGLSHAGIMAKIDKESGKAYFEFTINQLTDYYWQSKVNELGGLIMLAPGDDVVMIFDRAAGYSSLQYEGRGAEKNNFRHAIQHEHIAEDSKLFEKSEAGELSFSQLLEQKMEILDRTLQKIDARSLNNYTEGSLDKALIQKLKNRRKYESYTELFLYMQWFKMKPSEADEAFLSKLNIDDDGAALSSRNYLDFIGYYFFHQYKKDHKEYKGELQVAFAEKLLKGKTLEMWKANRLVSKIQRGYAKEADLTLATSEVSDSLLVRDINTATYNFRQSQIADYHPKTNFIKGEFSSVKDVLALFKGKVIYIDFWGSWCGPCISSLPNNFRTQTEFAEKDVAFLFLGGNDLEKYWLRAIKKNEISGHHYLMSDEMLKEASALFEISGFPSYSLVDKEGNIVDNKPGKYANQELFDKIEGLLKK